MWGRQWLWASVALCALTLGVPAQATPPAGSQAPPPGTQPAPGTQPTAGAPDDDFIEFLGGDDVGDAAWWEFLKKVPPRGDKPPATPPQDAKQ